MADERNNVPPAVPYIVHESEMTRMERINRRLWILCTVLGIALILTGVCRW